ncbi:DIE2/ALG10 family protein [Sarocladium implicatum]|nr:DIE2/ALG10 family protein [Sarocladium implicatum]
MASVTGESAGAMSAISPTRLILGTMATIPVIKYVSNHSNGERLQLRWLWYVCPPALLSLLWAYVATRFVPEPYLDEVFHIPQVQTYAQGKYWDWDPKLTTPPGLYIFSLALFRLDGIKGAVNRQVIPTVFDLRATNTIALFWLGYLALRCRHELERLLSGKESTNQPSRDLSWYNLHTALNICLFPLLFFFSGLYYTDVASTLSVLAALLNHLKRVSCSSKAKDPSLVNGLWTLVLGNATLVMRQTNVFWVVVFMGGLEAVHAVKSLKPTPSKDLQSDSSLFARVKHFFWRSSLGDVHDEKLSDAWVEDWVLTAASLLVAGFCNFAHVLTRIWPYIGVLASFVGFVLWNGSVVLGDKTNHVATIHLAQMLYIWPFFAFFSLPLLLPYAFSLLDRLLITFRPSAQKGSTKKTKAVSHKSKIPASMWLTALNALYVLGTILFSVAIVRYNTIIHPFTLADNRHYMFYIFRYTIRRASSIRYGLVLGYTISRWLIWGLLSGPPNIPAVAPSKDSKVDAAQGKISQESSKMIVTTSTAIIFLLATSLSLITAPLVEPRYFIIPWVIWRLLIPAWHVHSFASSPEGGLISASANDRGFLGKAVHFAQQYDVRLILETSWFLLVNGATIAIFLLKPYQWRDEHGTLLDEGRLQRVSSNKRRHAIGIDVYRPKFPNSSSYLRFL